MRCSLVAAVMTPSRTGGAEVDDDDDDDDWRR